MATIIGNSSNKSPGKSKKKKQPSLVTKAISQWSTRRPLQVKAKERKSLGGEEREGERDMGRGTKWKK